MKYIDAHCHIISDADIKRANAAGVSGFVVNATCMDDWARVVDMSARRDINICGAIGIHPWYVGDAPDGWNVRLREILSEHPDMMVGETGLDKTRPNFPRQVEIFRTHLAIAADMRRVMHVHCVGAWGDMLDILRAGPRVPALVFHSFSGAADIMPELMRYNAYFSFGRGVLNARHARMCTAVRRADINRILVESDAPHPDFMPWNLSDIVEKVAALRGVAPLEMADAIYNNTRKVISK